MSNCTCTACLPCLYIYIYISSPASPSCYTRGHTCGLDQGGAAHQLLELRTSRRPTRLAVRVPSWTQVTHAYVYKIAKTAPRAGGAANLIGLSSCLGGGWAAALPMPPVRQTVRAARGGWSGAPRWRSSHLAPRNALAPGEGSGSGSSSGSDEGSGLGSGSGLRAQARAQARASANKRGHLQQRSRAWPVSSHDGRSPIDTFSLVVLLPEVFAALFLRLARSRSSALGGGGGGGSVSRAGSRRNAGDKRCWRECGRGGVALG